MPEVVDLNSSCDTVYDCRLPSSSSRDINNDDNVDLVVKTLNEIRIQHLNKIIVAHLNINSIRNKFEFLVTKLNNNIDILMITETKLDDSFPINQFRIDGFQIFRFDRSSNGGGIIFYIRDNIPAKQLNNYILPNDIEAIIIEINLWKRKWLICGSYNPHEGKTRFSSRTHWQIA